MVLNLPIFFTLKTGGNIFILCKGITYNPTGLDLAEVSRKTFLKLLPVLERTNLSGGRGRLLQGSGAAGGSANLAPAMNAIPPPLASPDGFNRLSI